jgi:ribonuclease HII
MTRLERALWGHGTVHVAGTDEVGRGPIAGPVYAAAVILPPDVKIYGIRDSKELSRKRCEELAGEIRRLCVAWHVAQIATEEVDDVNIRQASLACMRLAISGLAVPPTHVLVDGRDAIPELVVPQEAIIRGDKRSVSIAAASILAKVARDAHMRELDSQYPGYGFARNSGYPVDAHKAALRRLGPCPAHRTSYDPVKAALAHS